MDCFLIRLQKFNELPTVYAALKHVGLTCLDNIRFDADARSVFKTHRVHEALNNVMGLSIRALEYISEYYSKGKLSECIRMASVIARSSTIRALHLEHRRSEEPDGEASRKRGAYLGNVLGGDTGIPEGERGRNETEQASFRQR